MCLVNGCLNERMNEGGMHKTFIDKQMANTS